MQETLGSLQELALSLEQNSETDDALEEIDMEPSAEIQ